MSMSNAFETAILQHIFQNANIADVGDTTGLRGSTAAGSLFVALHTADPGEAGTQLTSEATYEGYAREAVVRSGAGWSVAGNQASNVAAITFGACTAGSNSISHFSIGTLTTGAGTVLVKGQVNAGVPLAVSAGITPEFAIGVLTTDAD